MTTTQTYRTHGNLTGSVTDLNSARAYLRVDGGMAQYIYPAELRPLVHSVTWDLTSEFEWEVIMVTNVELDATQLAALSAWVSGQNSDGLGEGFEQQPFAEVEDEDDEEEWSMVSFDWQDNDCAFEKLG